MHTHEHVARTQCNAKLRTFFVVPCGDVIAARRSPVIYARCLRRVGDTSSSDSCRNLVYTGADVSVCALCVRFWFLGSNYTVSSSPYRGSSSHSHCRRGENAKIRTRSGPERGVEESYSSVGVFLANAGIANASSHCTRGSHDDVFCLRQRLRCLGVCVLFL